MSRTSGSRLFIKLYNMNAEEARKYANREDIATDEEMEYIWDYIKTKAPNQIYCTYDNLTLPQIKRLIKDGYIVNVSETFTFSDRVVYEIKWN